MSPRTSGRRRMFGKARKTVKIEGQKFSAVYSMSKVVVHEPPPPRNPPPGSQPREPRARVHGPYQYDFDYTPFMPKKRNGRWVPGKWLPLIAKEKQGMCTFGYHACTMDKTKKWTSGWRERERVWLIEGVGPITTDPKSQTPLTTKIIYRLTKGTWQPGRFDVAGNYTPSHATNQKRVRDKRAERVENGKVIEARENGGHVYDIAAEKYNFQSIRFIRPVSDAPKREKKSPPLAPTTWRYIKPPGSRGSIRVKVYAKTGFLVPGQGVKIARKKR